MQSNIGAETVPDHMRALDSQRIEQMTQVRCMVRRRIPGRGHIAVAVPTQIIGRDSIFGHQSRHDFQMPDGQVPGDAVDHDDIRSFAGLLVMQLNSVGGRLIHIEFSYSMYPSARSWPMTSACMRGSTPTCAAMAAGLRTGASNSIGCDRRYSGSKSVSGT